MLPDVAWWQAAILSAPHVASLALLGWRGRADLVHTEMIFLTLAALGPWYVDEWSIWIRLLIGVMIVPVLYDAHTRLPWRHRCHLAWITCAWVAVVCAPSASAVIIGMTVFGFLYLAYLAEYEHPHESDAFWTHVLAALLLVGVLVTAATVPMSETARGVLGSLVPGTFVLMQLASAPPLDMPCEPVDLQFTPSAETDVEL